MFDIAEEEKEAELQNHSEKFAIAFGFINTASNRNPSCEEFKDELGLPFCLQATLLSL
jgi:hypothetical protein